MTSNLHQPRIDKFSTDFYELALRSQNETLQIRGSDESQLTGITRGIIKFYFNRNLIPRVLNARMANLIVKKGSEFIPSIIKTKA